MTMKLVVLSSNAGFFIGVADDDGFSRESRGYWKTAKLAQEALASGNWEGRANPALDSSFASVAEFEAAKAAARKSKLH